RERLRLSRGASEALEALARASRCTMNVVVQAGWACVLHGYTGERDVVFGSTVSGRPAQLTGVERMMGLFINTLPVRVRVGDGDRVGELLERIHAENLARDEHGYLSRVEIQRQSGLGPGVGLFDSLLTFENYPMDLGGEGGGQTGLRASGM